MNKNNKISCVYKIVERCNINCTYCYFFYGGDESYKEHPPYASFDVTQDFANFLKQGCLDLNLSKVTIGYHGGEPLMIGPKNLAKMCDIFNETLRDIAEVEYTLQTNGILINDEWIEVFDKYHIYPGISLDGPAIYNDIYRLDKKGKSTYERTVRGIKKLIESKLNYYPGVLCVINPNANPRKIYRHFVDELNLTGIDFLLPHTPHGKPLPGTPEQYGKFLCELFDEWANEDNPNIRIRLFKDAMHSLSGGYSSVYGRGFNDRREEDFSHHLLNVSSNGDLGPVSELMTTSSDVMHTGYNVKTHTLSDLLNLPVFRQISEALKTVPDACKTCCWQRVCGGGDLVTRFSKERGFNNPSTLCTGLYEFYSHVAAYMLSNGIDENEMLKNINIEPSHATV
ncbi:MAG: radical SAM protein [Proteobacteria bacterium]|nr:radical SAM protein [Pseudomonadota bacterium]